MKEKEIERLNLLKKDENELYNQGIKYIASDVICSYNFSRFFSDIFLESFTPSIKESFGIITQPTTTGPASGPLPASSIPAIYLIP